MSCPHGEISEEYSSGHAQKWEVNHLQKLESYSSYLIFYSLSNQEVFQKKYAKSQIKSKNKKKKVSSRLTVTRTANSKEVCRYI